MSHGVTVSVTRVRERLAVVAVDGDLDLSTAGTVYVDVTQAAVEHPDVVLDLSGVEFCDSSGFNALLRIRRRILEAGGWLALAAPTAQIGRLLALASGDQEIFPVYANRHQALAAHDSV